MKPVIIPIAGMARHGKDTLANCVKETLQEEDYDVQIISYGDGVKEKAYEEGWDGKKDKEGRSLLQSIGQGAREENKSHWIEWVEERLKENVEFVLIPDARYENEIEYWKNNGYNVVSIKVLRFNETGDLYDIGLTEEQKKHPSERSLKDYKFDFEIINDKSLEEFKNLATALTLWYLEPIGAVNNENTKVKLYNEKIFGDSEVGVECIDVIC